MPLTYFYFLGLWMSYLTKDTSWKYLMMSAKGDEGVIFSNQKSLLYLYMDFVSTEFASSCFYLCCCLWLTAWGYTRLLILLATLTDTCGQCTSKITRRWRAWRLELVSVQSKMSCVQFLWMGLELWLLEQFRYLCVWDLKKLNKWLNYYHCSICTNIK